ncbi:MAG: hydrolase, partial [Bacteroidetes bacterium]
RQFPTASLAYTGILVWDAPPPSAGTNLSLIPYVAGGLTQDPAGSEAAPTLRAGGDAKYSITSSLNLDMTVNPDFSQVEVDRQVTNLSRFELFFPERRQFFLENSDLFDNLGYAQVRPFFSRRIGLNSPILYGLRVSGKPDRNWRVGLMNMQTRAVDSTGIPAQNFSVAAIQRQLFARSSITAFMVNRESLPHEPQPGEPEYSAFNRVAGLEYNLASSNNIWTGKALFSKSFSPGNLSGAWVHAAGLAYNRRRVQLAWQHEYVGPGYRAEVGFVPRNDYFKVSPTANFLFFPGSEKLVNHGPSAGATLYLDRNLRDIENETYFSWNANWRNQSRATIWIAHDYVFLQKPFDPTNTGGDTLARNTDYRWNAWGT